MNVYENREVDEAREMTRLYFRDVADWLHKKTQQTQPLKPEAQ